MRYTASTTSTVEDRIRSGGLTTIPEFCEWASISRVTAYKQIKKGQLKVVKIGRSTKVAGVDALAYVAALRGLTA
jgi:predicted DNA-binding transcriptional regulator AlpA